jgi:hypothetical protein
VAGMRAAAQTALTRPEAEQVLRVARLDGAHRAVLYAHNGPFRVERHRVRVLGVDGVGMCASGSFRLRR